MRRAYADTRLGQLHFAEAGSGTPLVLLPQGGRSWTMFRDLALAISGEFRCVALDYPGSGGSDPMPDDVTFEVLADAVVDLLDHLGIERACVYGIHTGNKIAAALAANRPSRVLGVILAGQSHSIVPSNERRSQTVGRTRRKLLHAADDREQALVHWADVFNVVSGAWWNEDLMREITSSERRAYAMRKAVDEIASADSMPALYRANFAFDLAGAYARIEVPALILEIATPAEDRTIGRQGAAVQSLLRGAELETLEAEDQHGITLEHHTNQLAPILRRFRAKVMATVAHA